MVFSVGVKSTLIPIPRAILDDIPNFLRTGDWVMIGSRHDVAPKYSLQDFIDHHPSRNTQHSSDSNYVASLSEHLKIADVTHKRTSKIRLRSNWSSTEK